MRFVCLALLLVAGCGRAPAPQDKPLTVQDVPAPVMKAATAAMKQQFPDVTLKTVTLRPNGTYEITGKAKNGKLHDVEITAAGEVLKVE